jgi:hypothetical protein
LAESEYEKPVGIRDDGEFVTLFEFWNRPELRSTLASLSTLPYEEQARFTVARLSFEPGDLKVRVLGREVFSRDNIISEVNEGSPIGRRFVQIERDWVERLKDKVGKGEYRLRATSAQTSATTTG